MDFAVLADHGVKLKESEKRDTYLNLARKLKKTMEHESDSDTNCNRCTQTSQQRIVTGIGGPGNKGTNGDYPHYNIIKIVQYIERIPGDLRRLIRFKLQWKTSANVGVKYSQRSIIIIIIMIMSCRQHGSPWPSPSTLLNRLSLPVGLQGYILYRHRAVVWRF